MQADPCAGLCVSLMFLLFALSTILGGRRIFRGFSEGFWAAFFYRLLVGTRHHPRTRGRRGRRGPAACLLIVAILVFGLGCAGPMLLLFLMGVAGPIPAK